MYKDLIIIAFMVLSLSSFVIGQEDVSPSISASISYLDGLRETSKSRSGSGQSCVSGLKSRLLKYSKEQEQSKELRIVGIDILTNHGRIVGPYTIFIRKPALFARNDDRILIYVAVYASGIRLPIIAVKHEVGNNELFIDTISGDIGSDVIALMGEAGLGNGGMVICQVDDVKMNIAASLTLTEGN